MRILIADDDSFSSNLLAELLGEYGQCDIVTDGMKATDAFLIAFKEKNPYKLICLDIMLPKSDGLTILKQIRDIEKQRGIKAGNQSKVVIVTALDDRYFREAAFEYGCNAYVKKPVDINKILAVLNE